MVVNPLSKCEGLEFTMLVDVIHSWLIGRTYFTRMDGNNLLSILHTKAFQDRLMKLKTELKMATAPKQPPVAEKETTLKKVDIHATVLGKQRKNWTVTTTD